MNLLELMTVEQQKQELLRVMDCNKVTEKFGLTLSEKEAKDLMVCRKESLKENLRIEFEGGILPQIIYEFCDSQYINQRSYSETISELQEIFYYYKNESMDLLTDDELLDFMRKQFDEVCFGDLDYLKGTCLERFAGAVRAGCQCHMQSRERDEYTIGDESNEYFSLSQETRWEYELFKIAIEEMD